ncbi:MAG: leucine-rich repeat protein [Firmicutes bacterium]|nr:leucine-rich repeat protein [Candidatus Colimorpha enterica]
MKKYIILFSVVMTFFFCLCSCGKDTRKKYDNFIYEDAEDHAVILGYSGTEAVLHIPSEIDGLPVTEIADNAFNGFIYLNEVYIPDSVTKMNYAFYGCRSLTYAEIGSGVIEMDSAFYGCEKLEKAVGYENAQIMSNAFGGCLCLAEGHIGEYVIACENAFSGCSSLVKAVIYSGTDSLDGTFEGCVSLPEISLPVSVVSLNGTFKGCSSLENIGGLDNVQSFILSFEGCTALKEIVLGQYVNEICSAFTGCSSLTKIVNMPDELENYSASFGGCSSLEYISVPSINGEEARNEYVLNDDFKGCSSLKVAMISADISSSSELSAVFQDCKQLEMLSIPKGLMYDLTDYYYTFTDEIYEGDNLDVINSVSKLKSQKSYIVSRNYTKIDGYSYHKIIGGEVNLIEPDEVAERQTDDTFRPFTVVSFFIANPDGSSHYDLVPIKRTYEFYRSSSRSSRCLLPERIYVNGEICIIV